MFGATVMAMDAATGQMKEHTLPTESAIEKRRNQLKELLKAVHNNPRLLFELCAIRVVCGSTLDACCKPIDVSILRQLFQDAVYLIIANKPVDGEDGNWNTGFMGSRWLDMDAKKYGLDYIRIAFYSDKQVDPKFNKQYVFKVTAELGWD